MLQLVGQTHDPTFTRLLSTDTAFAIIFFEQMASLNSYLQYSLKRPVFVRIQGCASSSGLPWDSAFVCLHFEPRLVIQMIHMLVGLYPFFCLYLVHFFSFGTQTFRFYVIFFRNVQFVVRFLVEFMGTSLFRLLLDSCRSVWKFVIQLSKPTYLVQIEQLAGSYGSFIGGLVWV